MTFKVFAVEMKDFKSYAGEHFFEFPQEPGLYYLTGKNEHNPRLGANGCGKTSLIDAIEWCIYGRTSRGLKATDIVTWGKKKCSVSLTLFVGDTEYDIQRTQNPNKIRINGEDKAQADIDNIVRVNQEAFNTSIVLPQFGNSFFDLTPTQKLSVFSQAMNLDYWLDRSKMASDKAGVVLGQITIIEKAIAKTEGRIETIGDEIADLKKSIKRFDENTAREIEEVEAEIAKLKKSNVKGEKKLPRLEKDMVRLRKDADEISKAMDECTKESNAKDRERIAKLTEAREWERQASEIERDIKEFSKLKGQTCPECLQQVDEKHVDDYAARQTKTANRFLNGASSLKKKVKKIDKQIGELKKDHIELRKLANDVAQSYNDARNEKQAIENEIKSVNRLLDQSKRSLTKLQETENPYRKTLRNRREARKELRLSIKADKEELEELRSKHEAINYWVQGFKRVRLYVIEEALAALEIEINNHLMALGLTDWQITLDVERENKSGGVTKNFTVLITSPRHTEPVKYESWSGGETQRLRLAGDLGLSNLIMEQAGLRNSIEFIDEPSEHMSPEGIQDMLDTLYERAHSTGKQIWLADHSTMDFGDFSGTLTSIMDKGGHSRLEYKASETDNAT